MIKAPARPTVASPELHCDERQTSLAFSLELPAGCPAVSRSGPTDSFISDTGGMVVGVGTTGLVRAWGIRDALYGVYATPSPPPPGCPVGVGTFVATRRVATPTPTTTPPGSSAVVGAAPGAGSFGLLVAGMATTPAALAAELASKGCAVSTLAIVRSGSWLIYVNGAPPVINAPFPSNVDATTPFFVRCN